MKFNETEISNLQALIKKRKPVTIKGFNNYGDMFETQCYIVALQKNMAFESVLFASENKPDKYGATANLIFSTGNLGSDKYFKSPRLFLSRVIDDNKTIFNNQDSKKLHRAAIAIKEKLEDSNVSAFAYSDHSLNSRAVEILKSNIAKTLTITQMHAVEGNSYMFTGICFGIDYAKTAESGKVCYNILLENSYNKNKPQLAKLLSAKRTVIEDKHDNFLLIDSII